ncbi:MAG: ATP-binding protein [Treponema sp.]|nr:ATP-binding protein [Treponema sp.]
MKTAIDINRIGMDLLENMQAAVALFEVITENDKVKDLRLLWANKLYLSVIKFTLEEAVGKLFSEVAEKDKAWIPLYGDVGLRRLDTQIVESYSDLNNSFIHVQAYSPEPGQVATILQIRSKFVQSELEKEKEEQKIRSMLGLLPEGILFGKLIYDKDKKLIDINCMYVNQAFEINEGVIVNSLQGKNFYEIYPDRHIDDLVKLAEAEFLHEKVSYIRKNIFGREIEINIYPQGNEQVFVIERDITERLRLEAADLANREKDKFLAHMSHEIRTPMNSIIGFSELAMDDEISPKTRQYFKNIMQNSQWLLQIINDILDISKIESGKLELEKIPFSMSDLFESCRTLIFPKAAEKGLTLHLYAEPSLGRVLIGDPLRLRQALVNLLSNAVKFTNSGIVKLFAAISDKDENSITMRFCIKDSGIGMTQEQVDRIFMPFLQAEAGTTRKYGGTGLGLSITKSIVEMMGGTLSVESTSEVGSKFSFEITFDTIDDTGSSIFEEKIALNRLEKPAFKGEVLLCEDNVMNQQVINEHLTRVGLDTVIAENGRIGVDMVYERKIKGIKQFDLIFMDIHMPVMDGLEASEKIISFNTGIPIVAITANIMNSDKELYQKSGMSDYIGKPFTSQELWHCLMKYFKPEKWQKEDKNKQKQSDNEMRRKLIENFVINNKNKIDEIINALNTEDIKLAYRLAHNLKSNAGQLDKNKLSKAAEEVEYNLKNEENHVTSAQIETLKIELSAVIAEFTPMIRKQAAPISTELMDITAAQKLLDNLKPILENRNIDCLGFIDNLRLLPGSEELILQIEDFEFASALITLAELKKKMAKIS